MSYSEHVDADRRLVILRVLAESAAYTCNEYLIGSMLDGFGHVVGADRVRTDLAWLAEQGLIEVRDTADVQIATLTQRGLDVANGRAVVPGVKRPAPGNL